MWHASISGLGTSHQKRRLALRILSGVGDRLAGEWEDDRPAAFHLRRRCTPEEVERVGQVVDLRGTIEGVERLLRASEAWLAAMPKSIQDAAFNEVGAEGLALVGFEPKGADDAE